MMIQRILNQRINHLLLSFLFCSRLFSCNFLCVAYAVDNGLGLTPPMGWNSWNRFGCNIDEQLIHETVDAAVSLGLDKLGYVYINLDDCWQLHRNSTGFIVEDLQKFPSGIDSLSEYVHSKGLKFGLYSDAGLYTCQKRPGSLHYEVQDAASYTEWKIDYLKYDNCWSTLEPVQKRYQTMHDALNGTGHPIFFSMCEWGVQDPATWAPAMANSWRTTGDIHRGWDSWTKILDANDKWWHYAGPGGWNDPDMLEVDNGKMTFTEERAHFTMWCLIKAPLLLGMDLRQITDQALDIITNEEVIIWNQDRLGIQGHCVFQQTFVSSSGEEDKIEVWTAPLDRGHHAVVLLNRGTTSREITATWEDLLITSATAMQVRDVWKHQNIGTAVSNFTALVEPHDIVAIQLTPAFDRIH